MSLQKCACDMDAHTEGWDLRECAKETSEAWLTDCIGLDFDLDSWLSDTDKPSNRSDKIVAGRTRGIPYSMSLAQQCEFAWYRKLLKSLPDSDRLRLISNSGPTQMWVTALPLAWKNWNLTSREWLIAARRRLGLDVRTKRTRCSNCRFYEIGLKGDHALSCAGRMGSKMRYEL